MSSCTSRVIFRLFVVSRRTLGDVNAVPVSSISSHSVRMRTCEPVLDSSTLHSSSRAVPMSVVAGPPHSCGNTFPSNRSPASALATWSMSTSNSL